MLEYIIPLFPEKTGTLRQSSYIKLVVVQQGAPKPMSNYPGLVEI